MKGAYPSKNGEADYCKPGRHFYEDFGQGPMRCKDCGHVKGQRRKR